MVQTCEHLLFFAISPCAMHCLAFWQPGTAGLDTWDGVMRLNWEACETVSDLASKEHVAADAAAAGAAAGAASGSAGAAACCANAAVGSAAEWARHHSAATDNLL